MPQDKLLARELFGEACHNGSAHAASNLARSLLHDGKPGDVHRVMRLYEEARCGGSAIAIVALARAYLQL